MRGPNKWILDQAECSDDGSSDISESAGSLRGFIVNTSEEADSTGSDDGLAGLRFTEDPEDSVENLSLGGPKSDSGDGVLDGLSGVDDMQEVSEAAHEGTGGRITVRARRWLVTVNNPTRRPALCMANLFPDKKANVVQRCSAQYEKGEGGTPHVHVFVLYKNSREGQGVKDHFEKVFGVKPDIRRVNGKDSDLIAAYEYCNKDETRDCHPSERLRYNPPDNWSSGNPSGNPKPKRKIKDEIYKILFEDYGPEVTYDELMTELYEKDREKHKLIVMNCGPSVLKQRRVWANERKEQRVIENVFVLYGASGAGKSVEAREGSDVFLTENEKVRFKGKHAWVQHLALGRWFGGSGHHYTNEPVVVIDEFSGFANGTNSHFDLDYLLQLLNVGAPAPSAQAKGGCISLNYHTIIITSQYHPLLWFAGTFRRNPEKWKALERRLTGCLFFPKFREDGSPNQPDGSDPWVPHIEDESGQTMDFSEQKYIELKRKCMFDPDWMPKHGLTEGFPPVHATFDARGFRTH
jgi:hypothetical protein